MHLRLSPSALLIAAFFSTVVLAGASPKKDVHYSNTCKFRDVKILDRNLGPDLAKIACPNMRPVYVSHHFLNSILKAPNRHWYLKLEFNKGRKVTCITAIGPQNPEDNFSRL